jgi:hypothetical protein
MKKSKRRKQPPLFLSQVIRIICGNIIDMEAVIETSQMALKKILSLNICYSQKEIKYIFKKIGLK